MNDRVEDQLNEPFFRLLVAIYGSEHVGFQRLSDNDPRGYWVKGLSHYPITETSVLFDKNFITDLEVWLTKNYVMYSTPRASQEEYRISFQMFPPGKFKKSYFDVKHNGTFDSIIRAKLEAGMKLAAMSVTKKEGDDDDV